MSKYSQNITKRPLGHSHMEIPALGAAGVAALAALAIVYGENYQSDAAIDAKQVTTEIAIGNPVRVLEDGSATIKLSDGKLVRVTNPILAKNGAVMERTRGKAAEHQVVTAYLTDDTTTTAPQNISYSVHGKQVTHEQAYADTTPLVITPAGNITQGTELNYFVAAPGQPFSGQPIAQGTPEHTVTVTVSGN
jgi:hypothetical protein